MSKLNKILLILVIVLLIVLGGVISWQKFGTEKPYFAVYLSTGDMYFGKLNYFPRLSLSDVWYLQRNPDDTQNPLSLTPFKGAFWGPEDKIYLNSKDIVWKVKLKSDSPVLSYIKNPQPTQSVSQQPQQQLPSEQTTSTNR
jgi:hypothetical protein